MDTDRNAKDADLLAALAERLREDPHYMAYVLATYQQRMGLDDEALANELGTKPEMIVRLAMCKRPDVTSASYERDLREMSEYTLADEKFLSQVIQRCFSADAGNMPAASRLEIIRKQSRLWGSFAERLGSALTRPAVMFVWSFTLLLIVGGVLVWRQSQPDATPAFVARGPGSDASPADTPKSSLPDVIPNASDSRTLHNSSADKSRARGIARQQSSNKTLMINLDDRTTLRDAGGPGAQAQKIIRLPLSRTTLLLRLAEGSSPGVYSVSIVDAFAKPVFSKTSSSRGRILRAVVDTRGMSEGEYRLCVRRESNEPEVPDCLPVVIAASRTHIDKPR